MGKHNDKDRLDTLLIILKERKLTTKEEIDLNQLDNIITNSMKKLNQVPQATLRMHLGLRNSIEQ